MHHPLLWTTKVSIPREIYTFLSHWTVITKSKPTEFSLSGSHTPQPSCCQMGETNKLLNQFLTNEMFASRTKRLLQREQCKKKRVKSAAWLKSRSISVLNSVAEHNDLVTDLLYWRTCRLWSKYSNWRKQTHDDYYVSWGRLGKVERGENGWFWDNRCRYTTLFHIVSLESIWLHWRHILFTFLHWSCHV